MGRIIQIAPLNGCWQACFSTDRDDSFQTLQLSLWGLLDDGEIVGIGGSDNHAIGRSDPRFLRFEKTA